MNDESCEECKSIIMKTSADGTDWDRFCETKKRFLGDDYYFGRCNDYKKKPETMNYKKCKECDDLDIKVREDKFTDWFCKDKKNFLTNIDICTDYKKKPEACGYCGNIIKTENHVCLIGLVMEAD